MTAHQWIIKLHAKRFKLRYSRNFGYAFNTISLNSAMNIGEMEQPRTGVTLPHYITDAGSWRKQMMIFCMLKIIRILSSVTEDFIFIVV
jgi:hypothetical protein